MESFVNEKTPRNGLHFISSKIWNNLLFVRQASELFLCDLTSRNYATITSLTVDRWSLFSYSTGCLWEWFLQYDNLLWRMDKSQRIVPFYFLIWSQVFSPSILHLGLLLKSVCPTLVHCYSMSRSFRLVFAAENKNIQRWKTPHCLT